MGSQRTKHSLKKGAQKNCKTKRNPKKTMTIKMQNGSKQKQKWIANQINIDFFICLPASATSTLDFLLEVFQAHDSQDTLNSMAPKCLDWEGKYQSPYITNKSILNQSCSCQARPLPWPAGRLAWQLSLLYNTTAIWGMWVARGSSLTLPVSA